MPVHPPSIETPLARYHFTLDKRTRETYLLPQLDNTSPQCGTYDYVWNDQIRTQICRPFLAELARQSGETAQLFLLSGDDALLAEVAESPNFLRFGPPKGQRVPLHCGGGAKALFAFQPPEEWDAYIRRNGLQNYTTNTVSDPEKLKRQLRGISRTRFAVSHQEFVPGVRCLGVPIWDATGHVTASLGLVGPAIRLTRARANELKPLMLETARRIITALNGRSE